MTEASGGVFSVGRLLFGEGEYDDALHEALREERAANGVADALKSVSALLRDVAFEVVSNVIAGLLDLNLTDTLGLGWRKYEALTEAARRSLDTPGEEQIVNLATHRITSTHRPSIDVVVDGVKVAEIDLLVELKTELEAVCAVVSAGRLIALPLGRAKVMADLWCEGVPVKSAIREIDLRFQLGLGPGIVLAEPPVVVVRLPDAPEDVTTRPPSP